MWLRLKDGTAAHVKLAPGTKVTPELLAHFREQVESAKAELADYCRCKRPDVRKLNDAVNVCAKCGAQTKRTGAIEV